MGQGPEGRPLTTPHAAPSQRPRPVGDRRRAGSYRAPFAWLPGLIVSVVAACTSTAPTPVLTPPPSQPPVESPSASLAASPAFVPAEDPALSLELVESGFSAIDDDGGGLASYGAILRNPNTGWAVRRAIVTIDFLDASGTFIGGEEVAMTLLPGQESAIGGQSSGAGAASQMEVHLPDDVDSFVPRAATAESFDVTEIRTEAIAGQWVTTGRIASAFSTAQSFVQLVAIHRNGAGAIIGGGTGGIQAIEPGATATFEIVDGTPYADVAETAVYWQVTR